MNLLRITPLLLVSACMSSGGGGGGSRDEDCSLEHRSGTFRLRLTEQSGNCGPVPESIERLPSYDYLPDGCMLDGPDLVSDDECHLERAYTCELDIPACPTQVTPPGAEPAPNTARYVAVTTEQTPDRITGTVSLSVTCWDGSALCVSTYGAEAVRE